MNNPGARQRRRHDERVYKTTGHAKAGQIYYLKAGWLP
jgi:hypothetical protein